MSGPDFNPGDRVVYTPFGHPLEGHKGTVMEVSTHDDEAIFTTSYYLLVILDTAEEVLDEACAFVHEKDWNEGDWIPF